MLQQAKQLFTEHQAKYKFYSRQKRTGFHRRLRNLAKQIDCSLPENYQATLTLDVIATRCDIHLVYKNE